ARAARDPADRRGLHRRPPRGAEGEVPGAVRDEVTPRGDPRRTAPPSSWPGALVPFLPVAAVLAGAVCYPALVLAWYGVSRDALPSLANLGVVLGDPDTWRVFWNTLAVSAWTTALTGALGTALALLVGRTDLPARRAFQGLLIVPYLGPPVVRPIR